LSNTPRQIFIARSLGYRLPLYAHIPFVAEPGSKTKLSKRKIAKYLKNPGFKGLYERGAAIAARTGTSRDAESFNPVLVEFYRESGFLPEAVVNYLLLLGWSLDDRTEMFSREEMVRLFSLERVVRHEAGFDPDKLLAFQARYMNDLDPARKAELCMSFLLRAGVVAERSRAVEERLAAVLRAAGDRIVIGGDILQFDGFFGTADQLQYDEESFEKRIRKDSRAGERLAEYRKFLAPATEWTPAALESGFKNWCAEAGLKPGDLIAALRIALTGQTQGFGLYDAMAILGRDECLARLDRALARRDAA
jgi:glutamyl-tRNA synthetase